MITSAKKKKYLSAFLYIIAVIVSIVVFGYRWEILHWFNTLITGTKAVALIPHAILFLFFPLGVFAIIFGITAHFDKKIYAKDRNGQKKYHHKYISSLGSYKIYPLSCTMVGLLLVVVGITNFTSFSTTGLYTIKTYSLLRPTIIPYNNIQTAVIDVLVDQRGGGRRGRPYCGLHFEILLIPKSKTHTTKIDTGLLSATHSYEAFYALGAHGIELIPSFISDCRVRDQNDGIKSDAEIFFGRKF